MYMSYPLTLGFRHSAADGQHRVPGKGGQQGLFLQGALRQSTPRAGWLGLNHGKSSEIIGRKHVQCSNSQSVE